MLLLGLEGWTFAYTTSIIPYFKEVGKWVFEFQVKKNQLTAQQSEALLHWFVTRISCSLTCLGRRPYILKNCRWIQGYFYHHHKAWFGIRQWKRQRNSPTRLERWWSTPSWKLFPNILRTTRWLEVFSVDLEIALYSEIMASVDEGRGVDACLSWFSQDFQHCFPWHPHWRTDEINGQWSGLKADWTAALKTLWSAAQSPSGGQSEVVSPRSQYWCQHCCISSITMWIVGQSAVSASLQLIENWEEWLIHQMVVLQIRGTSTSWKKNWQESQESQQREMQSPPYGEE